MQASETMRLHPHPHPIGLLGHSLLFVLLWSLPCASLSQVLSLEEGVYMGETAPLVITWMDSSRQVTYPQAMAHWAAGRFLPYDKLDIPGKFRRGAYVYWMALEVENCTADTYPLYLSGQRLSDDSTWHFSRGRSPVAKKISNHDNHDPTGSIPFELRRIAIWNIAPWAHDTILIKHESFDARKDFTPKYGDARAYGLPYYMERTEHAAIFLFGFGAVFSVFLYALGIWIGQRDPVYGWYAGYCGAIGFVAWWNFEVEVPSFHFFSTVLEWAYFKVFINTVLIGLCYAQFVRHFFRGRSRFIERATRLFVTLCLVGVGVELVLLPISLHWSWVFYFHFRASLVMYALVVLTIGMREEGVHNKMIIAGGILMFFFVALSSTAPSQYTLHVAMVGVLLDMTLFMIALSIRGKLLLEEKSALQLEAAQATYEKKIEAERIRSHIAQDIHDEVGSALTKIALAAQVAARLPNLSAGDLKERLAKLETAARIAAGQLREVIFAINPDYDNFADMQAHLRESAHEFWQDSGVELHIDFADHEGENPSVPPEVKRQLMLICKEAQNNIAKHAQARHVWLSFSLLAGRCYRLEVKDDGRGFDTAQEKPLHHGIPNIKKRAEQIGATLHLVSEPQKGTCICVEGCL